MSDVDERLLADAAGLDGMKTGEGFRKWSVPEAEAVRAELSHFLVQKAKLRGVRTKQTH